MSTAKEIQRPQTTAELWPTKTRAAPASQGTNREMFAKLDADLFMANQLFRIGRSSQVLAGVQGATDRREKIRAEILRADLADRPLRGLEETFAQAFERLYHEPLQPTHGETMPCSR